MIVADTAAGRLPRDITNPGSFHRETAVTREVLDVLHVARCGGIEAGQLDDLVGISTIAECGNDRIRAGCDVQFW